MLMVDVDKILMDYSAVVNRDQNGEIEEAREAINKYFSSSNTDYYTALANPAGRTACNKLTDFCWSTLFPADGSWIMYTPSDPTDIQSIMQGKKAVDIIHKRLLQSNFYGEMNTSIRNSIMFGRSMLETTFGTSISFTCMDDKQIFVSRDSEENARAYTKIDMTLLDLTEHFVDVPEHLHKRLREDGPTATVAVLHAILPTKKYFGTYKGGKKMRYSHVYILMTEREQLTPKTKEAMGCDSFPIMSYRSCRNSSLANDALSLAVVLEKYEQLHLEQTELSMKGPMRLDAETVRNNTFNLGRGGIVAVETHRKDPEPIRLTQDYRPNDVIIQRKQMELEKIFMSDMIAQAAMSNVPSFEYHQNNVKLLLAVQPLVMDLATKATTSLLYRVHKLLSVHDLEYKQVAQGMDGYIHAAGITNQLKKSKMAMNVSRFLQAATPIFQSSPESLQQINTDRAIQMLAISTDLVDILRKPEEVNQERQAQAQQVQQQQQAALAEQQASAEQKSAAANKAEVEADILQ